MRVAQVVQGYPRDLCPSHEIAEWLDEVPGRDWRPVGLRDAPTARLSNAGPRLFRFRLRAYCLKPASDDLSQRGL